MSISPDFLDYLQDQFSIVGEVSIRKMFGGAGLYFEGVMFGLVADETVYLKADAHTRKAYESKGMGPFIYDGKGKPISMSYYQLPEDILEDQDHIQDWALQAIQVAKKAKFNTTKPPKRKAKP